MARTGQHSLLHAGMRQPAAMVVERPGQGGGSPETWRFNKPSFGFSVCAIEGAVFRVKRFGLTELTLQLTINSLSTVI